MSVTGLHHVQVSCPPGGEDDARRFWVGALGLTEVDKPADLVGRGGCWFRAYAGERVVAEVHVGVQAAFAPARKAHPALVVDDLDATAAGLRAGGFSVDLTERDTFAGHRRLHTADAHGNRVEVLESVPSGERSPVGLPAGPA